MRVAYRVPLLVAGFLSLGFGVAAGLARLGFGIELPSPMLAVLHGPLMGGAFLGTVISLERAVALGARWAYAAPLAAGIAGLAWILGAPVSAGAIALVLGGFILLAASLHIFLRQPELHNACLAFGASCLPLGAAAVAAGDISSATPAWLGFLVLTIAGERLELSRFMPPSPRARMLFAAICIVLLLGTLLAVLAPQPGWKVVAAALIALAIWLAAKDVARRTVRERGLTRYIACALLLGYAWLAIGALIALGDPMFAPGRPAYDAALHAWFLGFVFSMVFGHAPIIAPALLRVALPYRAWFYLPLVVLHASLAERIAGDLLLMPALRERGAAGNAAAIAIFIATMLYAGLSKRRS
ncbi:MAG: hypothetical protein A2W21_06875 [Betaproteobacteria bacterium RBG_16_66_20]|nr:MAG: hypothetical protein A2W21_06875 [Betaproteobacteria bacterium RBG_16_66_20]